MLWWWCSGGGACDGDDGGGGGGGCGGGGARDNVNGESAVLAPLFFHVGILTPPLTLAPALPSPTQLTLPESASLKVSGADNENVAWIVLNHGQ